MRFGDSWDAGHPFPPRELVLTRTDMEKYETLADQLVAETLQVNEEFIADRRFIDPERWKLVKERGTMSAYCMRSRGERRLRRDRLQTEEAVESSYVHRPKFYSSDSPLDDLICRGYTQQTYDSSQEDSSSLGGSEYYRLDIDTPEQSILEKMRPPNTPMVVGGGVIPGTVDDAGLGFLADTEERSIMRAIASKDLNIKDLRVLAQIRSPTSQDPFQFLGIKWSSYTSGQGSGMIVKPRDLVVIESTGMTTDSNGEQVFYFLSHSVEIEEVPEYRKQGLVRINASCCRIVRTYNSQGDIEIFFRGYSNAGGNYGVAASTQLLCEHLLDSAQVVEESYMKKLAWFVHSYARRRKSLEILEDKRGGCACCHKMPTKGFKKFLESTSTCFLCRHKVCKKCTVKKNLPLDLSSKKSLEFCLTCYLKAKQLSARKVALATVSKT
ncbi:Zinc finger, RING/FYVE/PHD-type [Plasmopara halstedii]|uniref:Zinc finger, RING/FYVE/PHD-type n=1 Tax=Plasmopara halstedii TaxID=4781 RepID=A0A0P1A8T6_PLAHL|nr:Zinc finger, RING/FYVE/PHD-type [Plasmopara halstedii]CEG37086.1 Zinc finger, RING/FYVE/PHD-type [Plasmopara halstedii]|eukprot:XP_024573455.1 Zinc finger, RING/FYVE/PHD-type [Plasmopara halstedii]